MRGSATAKLHHLAMIAVTPSIIMLVVTNIPVMECAAVTSLGISLRNSVELLIFLCRTVYTNYAAKKKRAQLTNDCPGNNKEAYKFLQIFGGYPFNSLSEKCQSAIIEVLCHHYFPSCTQTNSTSSIIQYLPLYTLLHA